MTKIQTGPSDFWRFFALREDARLNRERGDGPPYSKDPILARYHFCNVFRECDAGTRYFQQFRVRRRGHRENERFLVDAVEGGREWREAMLWQACLYRPINRVSTFEAFRAAQSPGSPFVEPGEGREWWVKWLRARFGVDKVFTGRHLNRGLDAYAQTVQFLEGRDKKCAGLRRTANEVFGAGSLKQAVKALMRIPGIGAFFGWQIACDLVESGALADDQEWAQLGPGAKRGAKLVLSGITDDCDRTLAPDSKPLEVARWLVQTQKDLAPGGFPRPGDCGRWFRFPVTLKDVEHALCEYVRYANAREGRPSLEVKPWAR